MTNKLSSVETRKFKSSLVSGSFWILFSGAIGFPLVYLRNFCINRVDPSGEVLGVLALILMFQMFCGTTLLFGGKNTVTMFASRLIRPRDRSGFAASYYYVISFSVTIIILVFLYRPDLLEKFFHTKLEQTTINLLLIIIPIHLLSTALTGILTAQMSFRLLAVILCLQQVVVAVTAILFLLFDGNILFQYPIFIWGGVILATELFIVLISGIFCYRKMPFTLRPTWPQGTLRFALFAQAGNIVMLGYQYIDQLAIVNYRGLASLGIYFALNQVARLIPLTVQQLGHLLLSGYSNLLAREENDLLRAFFRRVSRSSVLVQAFTSLVLIGFSLPIATIFGKTCGESHVVLICLACSMNCQSLRTADSMFCQAHTKMGSILCVSVIQVVAQLILTILLIGPIGVYGVIIARGAGNVVQQIGLFFIVGRCLGDRRIYAPKSWWISQAVVLAATATAICLAQTDNQYHYLTGATIVLVSSAMIWFLSGYKTSEFKVVFEMVRGLKKRKSPCEKEISGNEQQ